MGNKVRRAQNRSGTRGQSIAQAAPASGERSAIPGAPTAEQTRQRYEDLGFIVSILVVARPEVARVTREALERATPRFPCSSVTEAPRAAKRGARRTGGAR